MTNFIAATAAPTGSIHALLEALAASGAAKSGNVGTKFYLLSLGRFRMYSGRVEIVAPRTANARALLTYLVAHTGQDIARERLIELFWSGCDLDRARGSLKTALWLIRSAIRAGNDELDSWLHTNKTIVRWDGPTYFDRDALLQAATYTDPKLLRLALQLYNGDFLEGHYGEWVDAERARIADVYESVLAKLIGASPDGRLAERLLERNPYSEEAYRVLIEERLAAGSFQAAARFAEQCVAALAEVGATPSDDIVQRKRITLADRAVRLRATTTRSA